MGVKGLVPSVGLGEELMRVLSNLGVLSLRADRYGGSRPLGSYS